MSAEVEVRDFSRLSAGFDGHHAHVVTMGVTDLPEIKPQSGHIIRGSMAARTRDEGDHVQTVSRKGSRGDHTSNLSVEVRGKAHGAKAEDSRTEDGIGPSDSASNKKGEPPVNLQYSQESQALNKSINNEKNRSSLPLSSQAPRKKKMKKGIFISYSPDAGFIERKFVVETVKQFKENNLAEDIWFDKDEHNTDSPCWFSMRMEAVERCRAALLILSESYFMCPVSVYEGKALLERQRMDPNSVKIYTVLYNLGPDTEIPAIYNHLLPKMVDLTKEDLIKQSLAEKTSVVVGALMMDLEKHATMHAPPPVYSPPDMEFSGEYKKKKICQWSASDLQEWLFKLGIKEFYRQALAENMVDGFLLMSMTDQDMISHLGIDSRVVRKKIMQQILVTLDKEHKLADNWHLRARTTRPKSSCIYLVYDPTDVRLAQNLKADLMRKNLQVIHHQKLGQSKEEFLQLNGPHMATASYVLVVLTESATSSPFVFHEVLFADWLGKKLVTAMFRNTWNTTRSSLKAVLGDCPAIDFETKMYTESMDVMEHHLKPMRTVPGVVLEQAYLTKMNDGIKPLAVLATQSQNHLRNDWRGLEDSTSMVFISYQWDMQSRVEDVKRMLESMGLTCWADMAPVQLQRATSTMSGLSSKSALSLDQGGETLQNQIQRNMKAAKAVISCITPKYMQSDNCIKDLTLADTLHKPIVPIMLRFCPWPPEGAPAQVRKILAKHVPIDLSNDKLFKQNIHMLSEKVRRLVNHNR